MRNVLICVDWKTKKSAGASVGTPVAGEFAGVCWASPVPGTVTSSRLDRGLRSPVQMAPTTVQSKWATTHPALLASSHNRGSYSAVWAGSAKGITRFEHIRRQAAVERKASWPGAVPTQPTHMGGGATRLACGFPVHGAAVGAIRQPPQRTIWV